MTIKADFRRRQMEALAISIAKYPDTDLAAGNAAGWTLETNVTKRSSIRHEGVVFTDAELAQIERMAQRVRFCRNCGAPLHLNALDRGVEYCRSCAATIRHERNPPSTRFDAERASAAAKAKHDTDKENARLAEMARAAGLR